MLESRFGRENEVHFVIRPARQETLRCNALRKGSYSILSE